MVNVSKNEEDNQYRTYETFSINVPYEKITDEEIKEMFEKEGYKRIEIINKRYNFHNKKNKNNKTKKIKQ